MLKLDRNYSDYTDETDAKYPEGKAINASTSESADGTPLLADFMNDINASHIAMYELAYGSREGISGKADTQKASQFVDAVAKLVFDKIKAHADLRGLADGVHGATSEATGGQIASRDEFGNIAVGSAINNADAINLGDVDQKFEDADLKEASHRDVDDDLSDAESENLPTTKAVNDALGDLIAETKTQRKNISSSARTVDFKIVRSGAYLVSNFDWDNPTIWLLIVDEISGSITPVKAGGAISFISVSITTSGNDTVCRITYNPASGGTTVFFNPLY